MYTIGSFKNIYIEKLNICQFFSFFLIIIKKKPFR